MDIESFATKFQDLRKQGHIRSARRGNTGVGHTLEQVLGLTENCLALPDLGEAELKSHRQGSTSLVTLFTLDRGVWRIPQIEAIHRYGIVADGRPNLYATLASGREVNSISVNVSMQSVCLVDSEGTEIAEWTTSELAEQFSRKFPALVFVTAVVEDRNGIEWFHYTSAQVLAGTSPELFYEGVRDGWIMIDIRMHSNGGTVRNHGTAFRIDESLLPRLFKDVREI